MSNNYWEQPGFQSIYGPNPDERQEKTFINVKDPFAHYRYPLPPGYPPPQPPYGRPPYDSSRGYLVKNNSRLAYVAVFDFEYDNMNETYHQEVNSGDEVVVTWNHEARKGQYNIVTMQGIVKNIVLIYNDKERNTQHFVLEVDGSTAGQSNVQKIDSRSVIDIYRVVKEGQNPLPNIDKRPQIIDENEPPRRPEDFPPPPYEPPRRPYLPPRYPMAPPPPPPRRINPSITWNDNSIQVITQTVHYDPEDDSKDFIRTLLYIPYSKKAGDDVILIITDQYGKVVYKAADLGHVISPNSSFTWDFRSYIDDINKGYSKFEKYDTFVTDANSSDPINVVSPGGQSAKAATYFAVKQYNNDLLVDAGNYYIQLIAGKDLLVEDYDIKKRQKYEVTRLGKNIFVSVQMIKDARVTLPVDDDIDEEPTPGQSTEDPGEEIVDNPTTDTPTDPTPQDPTSGDNDKPNPVPTIPEADQELITASNKQYYGYYDKNRDVTFIPDTITATPTKWVAVEGSDSTIFNGDIEDSVSDVNEAIATSKYNLIFWDDATEYAAKIAEIKANAGEEIDDFDL